MTLCFYLRRAVGIPESEAFVKAFPEGIETFRTPARLNPNFRIFHGIEHFKVARSDPDPEPFTTVWSAIVLPQMLRRFAVSLRPVRLFLALCLVLASSQAAAESAFLLPYPSPESFGEFSGATFDDSGRRVGDASIHLERLANGDVSLRLRSGFTGGARIELHAELERVVSDATPGLRILRERSQSFDPKGKPLVILSIDHVKGEASCTPPATAGGKASVLPLPKPDRVVNVPLNLLFQLLGPGGVDRIQTRVFFCLGGARMLGFTGKLAGELGEVDPEGRRIQEARYGPDGKSFLSWAAKGFAPKISFWIDVNHPGVYVAHRMPLYSGGPVVYVILDGIEPSRVIAR